MLFMSVRFLENYSAVKLGGVRGDEMSGERMRIGCHYLITSFRYNCTFICCLYVFKSENHLLSLTCKILSD